jgi:hypothetical protein
MQADDSPVAPRIDAARPLTDVAMVVISSWLCQQEYGDVSLKFSRFFFFNN